MIGDRRTGREPPTDRLRRSWAGTGAPRRRLSVGSIARGPRPSGWMPSARRWLRCSRGWRPEVELESAGGATFGGDFVVAATSPDGELLEVAVVDVSGKGIDAGTRALLCSGALSALLGAVPPAEFLPAANAYLLRQGWD